MMMYEEDCSGMLDSLSALATVLSMPRRLLHTIQDALDLLDVSPVPKLDHGRFRRPHARVSPVFQREVDAVPAQQFFDASDFGRLDHDVRAAFCVRPNINRVTGKMIPHESSFQTANSDQRRSRNSFSASAPLCSSSRAAYTSVTVPCFALRRSSSTGAFSPRSSFQ